jgi:hypothetical protein
MSMNVTNMWLRWSRLCFSYLFRFNFERCSLC